MFGEERSDYILIGVATEILLKAIVLKTDPIYFLDRLKGRKTLSYAGCVDAVAKLLQGALKPEQLSRLTEVLELVRLKRDNLVHLGFHQADDFRENYQVANVLVFLFSYFSDGIVNRAISELKELREEQRKTIGSSIDYEPIDFPVEVER